MALTKLQRAMLREPGTGGVLYGALFANDVTSPDTFFTMTRAVVQDSETGVVWEYPNGIRKNIGAAWAAGADLGCLDTGSLAPSTWYHVFGIYNPTTRQKDLLASVSLSNPVRPSGYTVFERLFSLWVGSDSKVKAFVHNDNDEVLWVSTIVSVSSVNDGQSVGRTRAVHVPPGMKVEAILLHLVTGPVSFGTGLMDPDIGTATSYNAVTNYHYLNINTFTELRKFTNVNSQVVSFSDTPNAGDSVISIVSKGYVDPRRKL